MLQESEDRKPRSRFEALEEWFFPAPVYENGHVVPAPPEALMMYSECRDVWMKNHPKTTEIPCVNLHPVKEEGRVGYLVQIGVVYPPVPDWKK